jgi:hypothetical protein
MVHVVSIELVPTYSICLENDVNKLASVGLSVCLVEFGGERLTDDSGVDVVPRKRCERRTVLAVTVVVEKTHHSGSLGLPFMVAGRSNVRTFRRVGISDQRGRGGTSVHQMRK